jgi:uncharacterized membrane protein YeaQ/YmgE (transglycosylase-associated protein family)
VLLSLGIALCDPSPKWQLGRATAASYRANTALTRAVRARRADYPAPMELAFVLGILLFGFVIGSIARLAVPGPDPMPIWLTTVIGVVGSVAGGLVAQLFTDSAGSLIFSFLGAIAVVIAYRRFVQKRGITGPGAHAPPTRGVGVRARVSRQESMLAELRDAGVLSEAEYEEKRRTLGRGV